MEHRPCATGNHDHIEIFGGRRVCIESDAVQIGEFAPFGVIRVDVGADLKQARPLVDKPYAGGVTQELKRRPVGSSGIHCR